MTIKGQKTLYCHREPRKGRGDLWVIHCAILARDHHAAVAARDDDERESRQTVNNER